MGDKSKTIVGAYDTSNLSVNRCETKTIGHLLLSYMNLHSGPVVGVSASRAGDPGFSHQPRQIKLVVTVTGPPVSG